VQVSQHRPGGHRHHWRWHRLSPRSIPVLGAGRGAVFSGFRHTGLPGLKSQPGRLTPISSSTTPSAGPPEEAIAGQGKRGAGRCRRLDGDDRAGSQEESGFRAGTRRCGSASQKSQRRLRARSETTLPRQARQGRRCISPQAETGGGSRHLPAGLQGPGFRFQSTTGLRSAGKLGRLRRVRRLLPGIRSQPRPLTAADIPRPTSPVQTPANPSVFFLGKLARARRAAKVMVIGAAGGWRFTEAISPGPRKVWD